VAQQGGSADKIGGEYEAWWTLWRITQLLRGQLTTMQLEPMGADGVELWVETAGVRTYDQAKFRSHGSWTIGRLVSEKVVTRVLPHLQAGAAVQFILSSASDDFSRLTVNAAGSESFKVFATSVPDADLSQLQSAWNVDGETAWRFLQRISVRHSGLEDLADRAVLSIEQVVTGDAPLVASFLKERISELLQQTITAQDIWSLLVKEGFEPRPRIKPGPAATRVRASLQRQRARTLDLIPGDGASTDQQSELTALVRNSRPLVVLVHGKAGSGKSSVVTRAATALEASGRYVAVVRLDQVPSTTTTAEELGREAALGGSPVPLLSELAHGSQHAVLVVDQLDAVSTYSGRSPEVFSAVEELLRQTRIVENVTLILAARSIDVAEDPRLRALARSSDVVEFTVAPLDRGEVTRYLSARGVDIGSMSSVTLELLRTPIHLYVYCQLGPESQTGGFGALPELYEAYTRQFRKKLELDGFPPDWPTVAKTLVHQMNESETLFCLRNALDAHPQRLIDALISANVLVAVGKNISFFHETYFDYLFAQSFEPRGAELVEWFLNSGQTLFKRSQLRQVLSFLSTQEPLTLLPTVREIMGSDMRPHLVAIAVSVLGAHDPTALDWQAVKELIDLGGLFSDELVDLISIPAWFAQADAAGDVGGLLRSATHWERAGRAVGRLFDRMPERVLELLEPLGRADSRWVALMREMVSLAERPEVIERVVVMIRSGALDISADDRYSAFDTTLMYRAAQDHPASAIQVVAATLERAIRVSRESNDPSSIAILNDQNTFDALDELATQEPAIFVALLAPLVTVLAEAPHSDATPRWRFRSPGHQFGLSNRLFFSFDKALTSLAKQDFSAVASLVGSLAKSNEDALNFLACRAMLHAPADVGAAWLLESPNHLHVGWMSDGSWESRRLIKRVSRHCSEVLFAGLEDVLVDFFPDFEKQPTTMSLQHRGLSQFKLLSALPRSRMSQASRSRLAELARKFPDYRPRKPTGPIGGAVGAPIPTRSAGLMSNDQWRRAIRRYSADQETWFRRGGPLGGAFELAQTLGELAKEQPQRFIDLALSLDAEDNPTYVEQVLRNVSGLVPESTAMQLASKFAADHGSVAGRATVAALQAYAENLSDGGFEMLRRLLADTDPSREESRVEMGSGYRYGGDLVTAGINSVRGSAVTVLAKVLFANPSRAPEVYDLLDRLVSDPIMAVRVLVAEPVLAVFNHDIGAALNWAEDLFSGDPELFSTSSFMRLLWYSVLNDPKRFAPFLATALQGPAGLGAGGVWINAWVNDAIRDPVPGSFDELTPIARAGAAEGLGGNPKLDPKLIAEMLADAEPDVRKRASGAFFHIDELAQRDAELIAEAALESGGVDEYLGSLTRALLESSRTIEGLSLRVADAAIKNLELGARPNAGMSPYQVVALVLRVYRQGNTEVVEQCLDLVDRLSVLRAWDLDRVLELGDA